MNMISRYNNLRLLSGDASHRIFYRKFGKKNSIIIYANKEKKKNLLVYDAINNLINNCKLSAPKLISENYNKNYIEVSDFGDRTLYKSIQKKKINFMIIKK